MAYDDVMNDDFAILKWLEKIVSGHRGYTISHSSMFQDQFGFCFVSGVPATTEDTEKLIRKINFIRHTQCESTNYSD